MNMTNWQCLPFSRLTTHQLYALLKVRVDVFVVEQTCPYQELDDKDTHPGVLHLIGYDGDVIVAYARLLPPGLSYPSASIGRVLTVSAKRGSGLGYTLIEQALATCEVNWPGQNIEIGAQDHLRRFYEHFGFEATSTMYLEDDIPHVDMALTK